MLLKTLGLSNVYHLPIYSKLRREPQKFRIQISQKETEFFQQVDAVFFDGRKDSTLTLTKESNGKTYMSTKLEEHYVVVSEPEEFSVTHFAPENGKCVTLAKHLQTRNKT